MNPFFFMERTPCHKTREILAYLIKGHSKDNTRLTEPFCGSASVTLFSKPDRSFLTDTQPMIVLTLEAIRQNPIKLFAAYQKQKETFLSSLEKIFDSILDQVFFKLFRDNPPIDPIDRAAWFIIMLKVSSGRRWEVDQKGKCQSRFGDYYSLELRTIAEERELLFDISNWLDRSEVKIRKQDYRLTLDLVSPGEILFVNPPFPSVDNLYTPKPIGYCEFESLIWRLRSIWRNGVKVIFYSPANKHISSLLSDFCRIFCVPWEFYEAKHPTHVQIHQGLIAVSHPIQGDLFPDEPEDKLTEMGLKEAFFDQELKTWKVWPKRPTTK